MRPDIADKLALLPTSPGVYLMKDSKGEVFYIGKAKSLRDRVRGYFSGTDTRAFVALLDDILVDIEVVLTGSDKEALLVEDQLVKRHRPRFNVDLKDDKRFLCLRLDPRKRYPRLEVVRRFGRDGARYFGPYTSAQSVREALRLVNRHFQLRTCSDSVLAARRRPCLQYQIRRCPAPCVFELPAGQYEQSVDHVTRFLSGQGRELVAVLNERMREQASRLNFEAAAQLRDQIQALERSLERQLMVTSDFASRDVVAIYREGPAVEIHVMRVRDGRLADAQRYSFADLAVPTAELLADFLMRYYSGETDIPSEILLPQVMEWTTELAELLSEKAGHRVAVYAPVRGDKRRLVELAGKNAEQAFRDKQRQHGAGKSAIAGLHQALHLTRVPHVIECVDVSHLAGTNIVASLVCFVDGVADKSRYRVYKIRSTTEQDDFQSIYEVISRRARRGLEEGTLPDLLVIDGGKGQLNAARAALDDHAVDGVSLMALAKARIESEAPSAEPGASRLRRRGMATTSEGGVPDRVFVCGQKNPVELGANSAELFLLTRLRDEAHRFAIEMQRRQRRRAVTQSVLDLVPGIGATRRRNLLRTFGSVARLRQASATAIAQVVGEKAAHALVEYLQAHANE